MPVLRCTPGLKQLIDNPAKLVNDYQGFMLLPHAAYADLCFGQGVHRFGMVFSRQRYNCRHAHAVIGTFECRMWSSKLGRANVSNVSEMPVGS
jgi:hypothetical protein